MKFTKELVKELVWEAEVETTFGENRRWTRSNLTIIEYKGKFYELYWEQGLTEGQDSYYEDQDANEVKQIEETIIIKKWIKNEFNTSI